MKSDIGNLAAAGLGQITRTVERQLKQIQGCPASSTAACPVPA